MLFIQQFHSLTQGVLISHCFYYSYSRDDVCTVVRGTSEALWEENKLNVSSSKMLLFL